MSQVLSVDQTDLLPARSSQSAEPGYSLIKRNGALSPFDASKISVALTKAFIAVEGNSATASRRIHEIVEGLTAEIVSALTRRSSEGRTVHIEDVQDRVELALMRSEHHKVARAYVLYRERRAAERAEEAAKKGKCKFYKVRMQHLWHIQYGMCGTSNMACGTWHVACIEDECGCSLGMPAA